MISSMVLRLAIPLVLLLLLAGCADDGDGGPSTLAPPGGTPGPTLPAVAAAREDLAARFERAPEEVQVVSVTREQWPDSCLGVAQEEEVCAQVITPGYEVVLRLDRNVYTFRTDEDGTNVRFAGVDVFAD